MMGAYPDLALVGFLFHPGIIIPHNLNEIFEKPQQSNYAMNAKKDRKLERPWRE